MRGDVEQEARDIEMRKSLCILLSLAAGISFFDMSHAPTSATQTFSISGKIVLDGRDWNLDVTLWLDPDHIEKTSALGDYSFHSLAPGEYIIRAYSKYCLPQIIDTVQISVANVTGVDDTLVVGDAVED